jgi:exopolyphosphatase/guanosine-5'-triphosphate,3'-diphosphate pyrophosphatase
VDEALACLARFGERIRQIPEHRIRAVGTNTLRRARNADEVIDKFQQTLGHAIEVLPGREEARLIYLGVAQSTPDPGGSRLVVDIGGGSTEVILGTGTVTHETDSLFMGCVGFTRAFFPDGTITPKALESAERAAALELRAIRRRYRRHDSAVGASGTIQAISRILRATQWTDGTITPKGLKKLRTATLDAGSITQLELPGLDPQRAEVFPGGLAVLLALFGSLKVESMTVSGSALREGLLYDLLGRFQQEDVRDRTIRALQERYGVDEGQAAQVERTAMDLLSDVGVAWKLERPRDRQLLSWAARLHEVGLSLNHAGYHKHGAYMIRYGNMPGFSLDEKRMLATLVRTHRRSVDPSLFEGIPTWRSREATRLATLLRMAVLLRRGRGERDVPARLEGSSKGLEIYFPRGYLDHHPLTEEDLFQEKRDLRAVDLKLSILEEE